MRRASTRYDAVRFAPSPLSVTATSDEDVTIAFTPDETPSKSLLTEAGNRQFTP